LESAMSIFQVDAFTKQPFSGNPAAVVPLTQWIGDDLMQRIAMENNLSETAFFVPVAQNVARSPALAGSESSAHFHIRWFTPSVEVNLCGHATLATAYVIFNELGFTGEEIIFQSQSGRLSVTREADGKLTMDLPSWPPVRLPEYPESLITALNREILGVYQYRDLLVELEDEATVRSLQPDFKVLQQLGQSIIVTAPGLKADFVSRFFAPNLGIDEDPVTGSAHTQLIPFWGEKLRKKQLYAKQLSKRGGELWCTWMGDRVRISGHCAFFLKGAISVK